MNPETGEVPDRARLYAKMAAVMGSISRVQKAGRNTQQSYNYATEADIADMIRDKLAANNIAFLVDMQDIEAMEITSGKGAHGFHYRIRFEFTFACGDTGATVSRTWTGEAQDWGDKGISKAATLAEKYFLIKTFVMSTGDSQDDPDSDDGRQDVAARTPARQPEPSPRAAAGWTRDNRYIKAAEKWLHEIGLSDADADAAVGAPWRQTHLDRDAFKARVQEHVAQQIAGEAPGADPATQPALLDAIEPPHRAESD